MPKTFEDLIDRPVDLDRAYANQHDILMYNVDAVRHEGTSLSGEYWGLGEIRDAYRYTTGSEPRELSDGFEYRDEIDELELAGLHGFVRGRTSTKLRARERSLRPGSPLNRKTSIRVGDLGLETQINQEIDCPTTSPAGVRGHWLTNDDAEPLK